MKKRGQVWVETVIYILIALVMITLVLSFALPKIKESQDRAIIDQSISMIEDIDLLILELSQGGVGNKRLIELVIKKGELKIDGIQNKIIFEMESNSVYSEPDTEIERGDITILTKEKGELNTVTLTKEYSNYDIQYGGEDILKTISQASTPYNLFISNEGGSPIIIDFDVS